MCSGRVDLEFILRAFANGMDGVFIGGCRLGECNYITHGNFHAWNMVLLCKRIMEHIGLNPDRLQIAFMSSGEGNLYTDLVDKFSQRVRDLGPLGVAEGLDLDELRGKLAEIGKLVPYIKVAKADKLGLRLDEHEDHADLYTAEEVGELLDEVVSYYIEPDKCQACGICLRRCPVGAISGAKGQVHVIDQDVCIKCGTCQAACPDRFSAISAISGGPVPETPPPAQLAIAKKGGGSGASAN